VKTRSKAQKFQLLIAPHLRHGPSLRDPRIPKPVPLLQRLCQRQRLRRWMEAFRAKFDGVGSLGREQWGQLLGHCGAVTDQPAIILAAEPLEAYPEAKVVMIERDVDSWYRSISALFATSLDPLFLALLFTDPYCIDASSRLAW
jgi:hypothetical protein